MKKSQYAVEYLLIVGIGLLILIPSIAIFYNYSIEQTEEAISSRVNSIGRAIVNNAETVYYMGAPSRRTIEQEFPDKIHNISIKRDHDYYEIRFLVGDKRNLFAFPSNIPITGPYYHNRSGLRCNKTEVRNACHSSGNREIILDAQEENIKIIIK